MKIKEKAKLMAMILTLAAIFFWMGADNASAEREIVKADGSSTVFPITEAVAEEFQNSQKGAVMVTVGLSGTGGGFKKFCTGETDISDASRPIKATEMELCKKNNVEYIELPVAFDGLAVMVNTKNTWVTGMTTEELRKIWEPAAQGKITKWSQETKLRLRNDRHLADPNPLRLALDPVPDAINGKEK